MPYITLGVDEFFKMKDEASQYTNSPVKLVELLGEYYGNEPALQERMRRHVEAVNPETSRKPEVMAFAAMQAALKLALTCDVPASVIRLEVEEILKGLPSARKDTEIPAIVLSVLGLGSMVGCDVLAETHRALRELEKKDAERDTAQQTQG